MKTLIEKNIKKFGGAIFFYLAIVGMILMVNYRFTQINAYNEGEAIAYVNN